MPVVLEDHANEYGTFGIEVSFVDINDTPLVPTSATWTLTDLNGTVVNNRNDIVFNPLASVMTIVLSGNDLATIGRQHDRLVFVDAIVNSSLGNGLRVTNNVRFTIDPIEGS
jgi:hypothetical protein